MAKKKPEFVVALTSFNAGNWQVVRQGDVYLSDDPVVVKHRGKFESAAERVERATARPGEVRNVEVPSG